MKCKLIICNMKDLLLYNLQWLREAACFEPALGRAYKIQKKFKNCDPNFLVHGDPHVPNMDMKENLEKEYFTMPP